ncbi:TraB/VirB10 family protein [Vibrio splendidus]|uniref:TraB/VirB10 family protein n=1 Tax=Vibrio splendidus TaxID=29497 RepID=UPI001E528B73|nr:TraB/VirB10 family protein [Vibrio splendidus]MCC4789150.1 TraB/VirB10 family protein [Vibrio splendidus]
MSINLKELWESNKNFRYAVIGICIVPAAFVAMKFIHPGKIERPDASANKIEKVFMPSSTRTQLEREDVDGVRTALVEISAIDKKSSARNDNYQYDQLKDEVAGLRQQMADQDAEIAEWKSGRRQLERTNYDPNQIRQGRQVVVDRHGNSTEVIVDPNGQPNPQANQLRTSPPPALAGIRSVDDGNDSILLQDGRVKTLVEANQLVDEDEMSEAQKREALKQKEMELAAALKGYQQKPEQNGYSISLPTTSLLTGTLLSGMQAPTSIGSAREPLPAVMRIKTDALLPNGYRADLRDCQALLSGIGQLSDRRAYMRLEKVVCIDEDGLTAEAAAQGFATGADGQAGIPGTLVARNGEVLKGSMWAGFFSGLAQGIAPSRVPGVDINSDGTGFQTPDIGTLGTSAVLQGGASSLDRISEYYVKMLEEIWPTVDVPAMQEVTFLLQAPLKLTFKEI